MIPTAELVVISGAAHGLMVEHASTFNRVLKDFLERAERSYQRQMAAGATAGHDANDRIVYNKKTGVLFYDEDGSGAKAAVQIAILKNKPASFSAAEFFVI